MGFPANAELKPRPTIEPRGTRWLEKINVGEILRRGILGAVFLRAQVILEIYT